MTDQELLERAAKASGIEGVYQKLDDGHNPVLKGIAPIGADLNEWWNPLIDDGDALRLAVQFNMGLSIHTGQCDAVAQKGTMQTEKHKATGVATRRAIVRAVASLIET